MTEKDKALIEEARGLSPIDCDIAAMLGDEADTEEARRELKKIAVHLYRVDESRSGLG